jgi:hypothetical protein
MREQLSYPHLRLQLPPASFMRNIAQATLGHQFGNKRSLAGKPIQFGNENAALGDLCRRQRLSKLGRGRERQRPASTYSAMIVKPSASKARDGPLRNERPFI